MSGFDYSTVPLTEPRSIRLLSLRPRDDPDDTVWVELEAFQLDKCPPFVALSYTWGQPRDQAQIRCNSSRGLVSIPRNLHNFLQRALRDLSNDALRRLLEDSEDSEDSEEGTDNHPHFRWLWADSVCINQLDNQEKGHQVNLMASIYGKATRTYIWLGKGTWDSQLFEDLVELSKLLAHRFHQASDARKFTELSFSDALGTGYDALILRLNFGTPQFFGRGWFMRKWVIQEFALSKQPILLFDHAWYDWEDIRQAFDFIRDREVPFINPWALMKMEVLQTTRDEVQKGEQSSLVRLLARTQTSICSDDRDTVLCLLGLAADCYSGRIDIQPDYNVDIKDLLRTATIKILLSSDRLDVLSLKLILCNAHWKIGRPFEAPNTEPWRLPSWSLDDNHDPPGVAALSPYFPLTDDSEEVYSNFDAAPRCQLRQSDLSADGTKLRLSGYEIGFIHVLGLPQHNSGGDRKSILQQLWQSMTEQPLSLNDWARRVCNISSDSRYEPTGEGMKDVFWQTLVVGQHRAQRGVQTNKLDTANLKTFYSNWEMIFLQPRRFIPTTGKLVFLQPILVIFAEILSVFKGLLGGLAAVWGCYRFHLLTTQHTAGRQMCRSNYGHIGMVPLRAVPGDRIMLVQGCRTPMIIRRIEETQEWRLIGDSYMHGLMTGETFDESLCKPFWLA